MLHNNIGHRSHEITSQSPQSLSKPLPEALRASKAHIYQPLSSSLDCFPPGEGADPDFADEATSQ